MATVETRTSEQETPVLKRHVGVVGLLFASVGSIIGSGWLFGALNASQQAGPAAIISWVFGGVPDPADRALLRRARARCSRCPAASSGSRRWRSATSRASRAGWITYVAVATTAPIEVEAALQYGTKYADFTTEAHVNGETGPHADRRSATPPPSC